MNNNLFLSLLAGMVLIACAPTEKQLKERATELCQYIPDHELLEQSRDYLTPDFYAVLDTMFNRLSDSELVSHEWIYYFVTGNGGTIAGYEVTAVELIDKDHAIATIQVRQVWEDGTPAEPGEIEEHQLYMERIKRGSGSHACGKDQWLMSDFDGHKQDCINYIANALKEQALLNAISGYLVQNIAPNYLQGELCVPSVAIVAENEDSVWTDCRVFWYNIEGDTLMTVSGGNHSGRMFVCVENGKPVVTAFVQTEDGARNIPSAKRIFGGHYDVYQNIHSNDINREILRREQLRDYVRQHEIPVHYYKDFGWEAKEIE